MLKPSIDKRFPTTVHTFPDGMSVVDVFMEARNRYPDLWGRTLIIVPTHKEVMRTIASLEYLKVGEVNPLTARERVVPKTGIIVATPYVETGADIKPAVDIVIDCGKTVSIDKGVFRTPLPWTDQDTNKQRMGRAARLRPGVVFQPESAGTGSKPVHYPSPDLFQHRVVADHFKVPALTGCNKPVCEQLPYLEWGSLSDESLSVKRSVALIHVLNMHGIRDTEWKRRYGDAQAGKLFGEDYEPIDRFLANKVFRHEPLLPFELALYHLQSEKATYYHFDGGPRAAGPLTPMNGKWVAVATQPTSHVQYKADVGPALESTFERLGKRVDILKSALSEAIKKDPSFGHLLERVQAA